MYLSNFKTLMDVLNKECKSPTFISLYQFVQYRQKFSELKRLMANGVKENLENSFSQSLSGECDKNIIQNLTC